MTPKAGDGMEILMEAMITGNSSAAIENQKARGQQMLIADETLPKNMGYNSTQEQFEKMGIIFGNDADDLFVYVKLPEGWSKQPTEHSMWSNLVDEKGRKRAAIFYKAAFYDRSAHMDITRRFSSGVQPVCGYGDPDYRKAEWQAVVTDSDEIAWRSEEKVEPEPEPSRGDEGKRKVWLDWSNRKKELGQIGQNWLDENYPGWENPLAYWDDDFKVIAVLEGTPIIVPWYERLWSWIRSL